MLINVKMPTIGGILTFMSRIDFVLSSVEYEKSFITSRPGPYVIKLFSCSTEHEISTAYKTKMLKIFKMMISLLLNSQMVNLTC